MARYELGRELSPADVSDIIAWLKTLTGEIPEDYIRPPKLPPSTPKTPKPSESD